MALRQRNYRHLFFRRITEVEMKCTFVRGKISARMVKRIDQKCVRGVRSIVPFFKHIE